MHYMLILEVFLQPLKTLHSSLNHQQLKGTFVGTTNSMLVIGQIIGSLSGAAITSYTTPATTFIA
jgi:hypothetical protein